MALVIPEVVIYKAINIALQAIKQDYNSTTNKNEKSKLFYLFGKDVNGNDVTFDTFNFYKAAVELFVGQQGAVRTLKCSMGFSTERNKPPFIAIMLPTETEGVAAIGGNEGYTQPIVDNQQLKKTTVYTENTSAQLNLLLVSDNYNEIVLMYHFLKAIWSSLKDQLEHNGLQNLTYSGQDLTLDANLNPANFYMRNFTLHFTYDYQSIDLFETSYGTSAIVTGKPVQENVYLEQEELEEGEDIGQNQEFQ